MAEEVICFANIHTFGGYLFQGYNEIKSSWEADPAYKITYENGRIKKLELERKGAVVNAFTSFPAIIHFSYQSDMISITFADKKDEPRLYNNIDKCVMSTAVDRLEYRAAFYLEGKRVADESGLYEIVYYFNDLSLRQIALERYFNANGKPLLMHGINWSGVECGSPGPDKYYYYSKVRYSYDEKGSLVKMEFFNERDKLVRTKFIGQ